MLPIYLKGPKEKRKMKKDFSFRKESVLMLYQKLGEGGIVRPFLFMGCRDKDCTVSMLMSRDSLETKFHL